MRQLLGVLLQRAPLALGVAAAVFVLILAAFAFQPRTYTAVGSVIIDPKHQNLTDTTQQTGGLPPDTSAVDTQVEVLRSNALALDVVKRLKLYNDPEFNPSMAPGLFGTIPAHAPMANPDAARSREVDQPVHGAHWVRRAGLTYVVQVGFNSAGRRARRRRSPTSSWTTYLKRQLDEKLAAVTRANSELGASLEKMRQDAETAEARVQEYKNAHGLLSAEGATMAEQEVSTLNQQIALAKADPRRRPRAWPRPGPAAQRQQRRRRGRGAGLRHHQGAAQEGSRDQREAGAAEDRLQTGISGSEAHPGRSSKDIRAQIQSEINRILSSLRAEADSRRGPRSLPDSAAAAAPRAAWPPTARRRSACWPCSSAPTPPSRSTRPI